MDVVEAVSPELDDEPPPEDEEFDALRGESEPPAEDDQPTAPEPVPVAALPVTETTGPAPKAPTRGAKLTQMATYLNAKGLKAPRDLAVLCGAPVEITDATKLTPKQVDDGFAMMLQAQAKKEVI